MQEVLALSGALLNESFTRALAPWSAEVAARTRKRNPGPTADLRAKKKAQGAIAPDENRADPR